MRGKGIWLLLVALFVLIPVIGLAGAPTTANCPVCGATAHIHAELPATCTEGGKGSYRCPNMCGTFNVETPKLGHD
ncbi:MAG: hypothetical protein IJT77_11300, partial [Clostridia bacterium]|nr:hypothetical protein [Clostridia bacterium]